ncbi:MAG: flagellar basal body-associated FliL family protein [Alphaproteobacteria bacterium]|nr:flagellar basal body-associated FliL family protein [Alphaproteobacteria bacterium]
MNRLFLLIALVAMIVAGANVAIAASSTPAKVERYVPLAPISRDNRPLGRLTIELTMEVLDPTALDNVKRNLPKLQAAYLSSVARYAGTLDSLQTPLQLEALMVEIKRQADSLLTPGKVNVLVQQAQYSTR